MKTILHAQIISNLLVVSSLLAATTGCQSAASAQTPKPQADGSSTSAAPNEPQTRVPPLDAATNHSATATSLRPPSSSWSLGGQSLIGRVLLRAANFHQDQRQQNYATSEESSENDEDSDPVDEPPSQLSVPTDSGEDALESSTTSTGLNDHKEEDEDDDSGSGQQQAPTPSSATLGEPDSELAVDSNNVSAIIIGSAPTIATISAKQVAPVMSCEQAYMQCALRKACAPALKAHNDHCHELISNQTNECSARCLDAMIALRSSEEGDDLASCDCDQSAPNDYCVASKQRSLLCKAQVDRAMDPKTVVSCSTASLICMADQSCATALGFYYRNCRSLLSQRHCSGRCNNSLAVLYRQPKALKLISCQCDGSEDFPCQRLKTFTEQLCLNRAAPSMDGDQLTTEEESSNLTNNPENFVLGAPANLVPAGAYGSGANGEDGDDEDGDNKDTAGEESSYNGIQLAEDNWIPLISGRYFTNLHHHQQVQLQAPGAPQQSKQRHKQKEQNHHKQQHQQQTRKVQRNMRQQRARSANANANATAATHQEGKRSRFGKIFMFAASTSSASSLMDFHWPALACALIVALAILLGRPCC